MVTNVTMDARTLAAAGIASELKNGWRTMDDLSENENLLLIEKYGHNWPELLELV